MQIEVRRLGDVRIAADGLIGGAVVGIALATVLFERVARERVEAMLLTQQIGKLGLRRSAARVLTADKGRRSSRGSKPTALGELLPLGRSKEVKDGGVLALGPQMQMHIGRRGRPRIQVGHRVGAR
jgi:hypothetical protein